MYVLQYIIYVYTVGIQKSFDCELKIIVWLTDFRQMNTLENAVTIRGDLKAKQQQKQKQSTSSTRYST